MTSPHRAGLRIDLLAPTIFSADAATTGAHKGLDVIPGSALLGLAASLQDEWQEVAPEPVWTVLRSGIVRFGPGYPLDGQGRVLLPVPRALHRAKAATDGRPLDENDKSAFHNRAVGKAPEHLQLEQVRKGFLAEEKEKGITTFGPKKVFVMKTAVDPARGTAMDGMLFGYEAFAAGQSFYAEIEADAAFDGTAFYDLVAAIAGREGRTHRLGRSRSAEFGLVSIRRIRHEERRAETPIRRRDGRLVVWALSDIALVDANGQPTLDPAAADLGLPDLDYVAGASFVGTRRYAPYVGRWRLSDLERQVITAGSVLVFEGPGAGAAAETIGSGGLGLERAAGLGRVWVNPPCLDAPIVAELPEWYQVPAAKGEAVAYKAPSGPLFKWLQTRAELVAQRTSSDDSVSAEVKRVLEAYESAEAYSGVRPDGLPGPSRSQWNMVAAAAREAGNVQNLRKALDDLGARLGDQSAQPKCDPAWGWRVSPRQNHADVLGDLIDRCENQNLDAPRTIAVIAKRVATAVDSFAKVVRSPARSDA